MEDVGSAQEEPIPARKFAPAPNLRRPPNNQQTLETRDMLPAEDVLQFVDLEELANPEKMAKKTTVQTSAQSGPPPDDTEQPENPVPANFPPAPTRRKRKNATNVVDSTSTTTTTARTQTPVAPSTTNISVPPAVTTARTKSTPSPASIWDNNYEVHTDNSEVYNLTADPRRDEEDQPQRKNDRYDNNGNRTAASATRSRGRERGYFDTDNNNDGDDNNDYNTRNNDAGPSSRQSRPPRSERTRKLSDSSKPTTASAAAPAVPRASPEEIRRRREEEEKVEKMQLLYKLYEYEQRGHHMASSYSMDSNVDELRFEVSKIRNIESAKHSVKWYKVFLMIVISTVETLNTKFDPFGIRLKGWSKEMNTKKDDLDDCFHRLHDKYSVKAAIEPELELAFAFFGGAFMYHLQNAADNFGEMGTLVKALTGAGGEGIPQPKQQAPPMTNMHSFQHPQHYQPQSPSQQQQQQQQYQPAPSSQQQQYQASPSSQQYQSAGRPQTQSYVETVPPPAQEPARVGKTGRRIMKGPPIPSGASDIASMLPSMMDSGPADDVPIPTNFTVPASVGGPRTTKPKQSSNTTATKKTSSRTASSTPSSSKGGTTFVI